MIENTWSIDWLSVTFKDGLKDKQVRDAVSFGFPRKAWTDGTPKFGYKHMIQHPLGHLIMFHPGRPEMGVHLSMGGRALRAISEGGHPATEMLSWGLKEGGKVTRIDLAIDVYDHEIDLVALASGPRIKDAPGSARKWSQVKGSDGGCTVYIGSRQSDKFLRIYDKAVETGQLDRPWTRFELEIKGDTAKQVAWEFAMLPDGEKATYIKGIMKAMFNPQDALYQQIMNAQAVQVSAGRDTDDNTLEWLMNSVSKTLAKTILRRSDVQVWEAFSRAVEAQLHALDRPAAAE